MAYSKQSWNTGDPITQERMRTIEQGIYDAHVIAGEAQTLVNNTSDNLTALTATIESIQAVANRADRTAEQAALDASTGTKAWTYLRPAMEVEIVDGKEVVTTSLATRLSTMQTYINQNAGAINTTQSWITSAQSVGGMVYDEEQGIYKNAESLAERIGEINRLIAQANNTANTAIQILNPTNGTAIIDRLTSIDNNTTPTRTLPNVIEELDAAHVSTANGTTYNNVDARLEADEATINSHTTKISALEDNTVKYTDVKNDFNSTDTDKPLSANKGKELKDTLGGTFSPSNTVASNIASASSTAEANAKAYADTNKVDKANIYNDLDYIPEANAVDDKVLDARQGKVLADRIDLLDNPTNGAVAALNTRLSTVEEDVEELSSSYESAAGSIETLNGNVDSLGSRITTVENDLNTPTTGVKAKVNTLESTINNATTGLAATKAIADENAADIATLEGRVSDIENASPVASSATVVIEQVTYNSDGIPTSISEPSADIDYLLKKDNKYYYWKYINNTWQLISGGEGGSGTSSAEFYAALTDINNPSDTVDYFIGSGLNYIHYRYQNNTWVMILPQHLINHVSVDTSPVTEEENSPVKSRPIIKEMGSDTNLLDGFRAIQSITATPLDGGGYNLAWTDIDGAKVDINLTGGGGSASLANAAIDRVTDANLTKVAGESCVIEYTYTATDSGGSTIAETTTAIWYVNRIRVATSNVSVNDITNPNDKNSFDITPYLQPGINNISVSIAITIDGQTYTRTKTWSVDVKNFSLTWNYDESYINDGSTVEFSCVPYGADITKVLHIIIDNHETTQTVTTSGVPVTITLPNNFEHGVHNAEMYMTATINDQVKTSNHVYHDFIVAESGNNTPIIAATLPVVEMDQYDTIEIPFVVYTPNSNTSTVVLAIDGIDVDTREVGRTTQKWYFTPSTLGTNIIYEDEVPVSGTHTLTLTVGSVIKTLTIKTNSVQINNEEIGGYAFKLKASELISNTTLQNWHYDELNPTTTKLQFSNNFDWINGGLKTELDENGEIRQYIRIKSGTRMTIPYKMFASDPRELGSDFKIVFKVENCRNYDAKILDTVSDNIGIQLNAHNATFQSTTTTVSTQYGEDEYTELEFEVYKATDNNNNPVPGQYMMAWIDGVITTARIYGGNFVQSVGNTSSIVIGSDDCDVCIYLVKYYPKALTINDHVINFIADAPNASEMIRRFTRNDILDPDDNEIDYQRLMNNNPDCRIWLYDIEKMPTSKDKDLATKVYNFQQLWKNGDQYYQLVGENAKLTIQGTSSVNYRKGAANTDINFGKSGATLHDGYGNDLLANDLEYKGFKINDDSLPITYSNTKVNFASCEQVNNMCNAEWYQRFQPYPSLTARDCMEFVMGVQFIKDRGENEESGEVRLFNEKPNRSDSKYYMYSIANMGTSKKNTHIFHDPNEVCVEVMANTSKGQRMLEWPTDLDWSGKVEGKDHSFELRYAEDENKDAAKAGWKRFIDWMVSYNLSPYDAENNPNGYTNAALAEPVTFAPYTFRGHNREIPQDENRNFEQVLRGVTVHQYAGTYTNDTFEYRMAKMLSECEDYMAMDSVVYHFLFIERHTMVDNVAKNTFWSSVKEVGPNNQEGFWVWDLSKNYDNDTSDGNNNEGQLVFDYGNEATDTYGAKTVFNAADSVWFIFISNLYEACRAMFINREGKGAWNAKNYHEYLLNEQRKVPERVWNECYWYDYLRTYENNIDTSWITFLDGGQKTHQRKHYETYEELYDASKYMSALSASNTVNMRGYTPPAGTWSGVEPKTEFKVKMYNKCYLTIHVDDAYKQIKCEKGVNNTISFYNNNDPAQGYTTMNDAVIKMDTAQMIQEIGDLSCLYPGSSSFTSATRLRVLHIGSAAMGYINPNMTSTEQLTFTNPMLEELNVQNLPYATYNLDLSKCPELKYINAAGSGFTGFEFANGGLLNEAYVNAPSSLVLRNLDYLTNVDLHITDLSAITSLRLEGGKAFDNYTFINSLTNLNVLRLTNINWTLSNSSLLDRLLGLMGINESGYTTEQSYLSGNVALTGTVYEGKYDSYVDAWSPDLVIDVTHANPFVYQHLVTYYNEDGTKLYEYYINSGDPLVDIRNLLDEVPSKPADIQYTYTFGQLDNMAQYIPFSGWRISTDSLSVYDTYGANPSIPVNGTMSLYAVYSTTPQRYTVRWLLRANQVVREVASQNYGGGYNLIAPTIKEVQELYPGQTYTFNSNGDNCTYTIMTGWDKTPANIAPTTAGGTYDIYATWLERINVPYTTVLSSNEYSVAEKLLVLRELSKARNTLSVMDKFPVTLGYDGAKPAINLVSAQTRYNGTPTVINDYTPFALNQSFTLAVDFKFDYVTSATANEAILLSCYQEEGGSAQGFKLFYNPKSTTVPAPQISFGSTASSSSEQVRTIGTSILNRGTVVLRHRAGDTLLYIYSGSDNTGLIGTYSAAAFRKSINWSAVASNAKIVLGGINITGNASLMNASGIIYSAKYWEEDLGESECLQLASWCHETAQFTLSDFDNGQSSQIHSAINSTLNKKLVLHTTSASSMGTIYEAAIPTSPRPTVGSTIGWNSSTVKDFYNNRIYQALPIMLQSIITPTSVPYMKGYWDGNQFTVGSDTNISQDYVFAPSCIEVGSSSAAHATEASGSFIWNGSLPVKQYVNGVFEDGAHSANYSNLRFPYMPNKLNSQATVYIGYPVTGSSFYQWVLNNSIALQPGDILIPQGDTYAYIYVTAADVVNGAQLTTETAPVFNCGQGGWIKSVKWTTRSVPTASANINANKFQYITDLGELMSSVNKEFGLVYSIAL